MGGRGPCRAVIRLLPLGCALLLAPSPTSGFVLFSPWGKIEQGDEYRTDPYISKDGALTWQGPQSFELYETVFLWSWPESELDHLASGGITWALHPDFCAQMLPHFPEASRTGTFATFLTCDDLHHAIASGLNTWAMNHRNIAFHDVTSGCEETLRGGSRSCAAAEVLVQTYSGAARNEAAKTVIDHTTIDFRPRLTSGEQLSFGLGVRGALLNVSTDAVGTWTRRSAIPFTASRPSTASTSRPSSSLRAWGAAPRRGRPTHPFLAGCSRSAALTGSRRPRRRPRGRRARRATHQAQHELRSPNHQRRAAGVTSPRDCPNAGRLQQAHPSRPRASKAHLSTDGRGEVGEIEEEEEEEGGGLRLPLVRATFGAGYRAGVRVARDTDSRLSPLSMGRPPPRPSRLDPRCAPSMATTCVDWERTRCSPGSCTRSGRLRSSLRRAPNRRAARRLLPPRRASPRAHSRRRLPRRRPRRRDHHRMGRRRGGRSTAKATRVAAGLPACGRRRRSKQSIPERPLEQTPVEPPLATRPLTPLARLVVGRGKKRRIRTAQARRAPQQSLHRRPTTGQRDGGTTRGRSSSRYTPAHTGYASRHSRRAAWSSSPASPCSPSLRPPLSSSPPPYSTPNSSCRA